MTPLPARPDSDPFVLTLWTNDVNQARRADAAGVQRIGVDLEQLGKLERQRGRRTWISPHTIDDLAVLGPALTRASLFARVNPLNEGSAREVETVIGLGAKVLMLPMVATVNEMESFVALVNGRARVVPLIENREALRNLAGMVDVPGVDEVHLGLNDLAMSLGLRNRWLALADQGVGEAAAIVRGAGLRFGLGGLGRVDDLTLPIPSDLLYAECARMGASAALLSRSFGIDAVADLGHEVEQTRQRLQHWRTRSPNELAAAHAELLHRAQSILW